MGGGMRRTRSQCRADHYSPVNPALIPHLANLRAERLFQFRFSPNWKDSRVLLVAHAMFWVRE